MEIKLTDKAQEFVNKHPEQYMPGTVWECFHGCVSINGISTPNLSNGLDRLDTYMKDLKGYRHALTIGNQVNKVSLPSGCYIKETLNNNLDFLINNCTVYGVIRDDEGKTIVTVNNIFAKNIKADIKVPESKGFPINPFKSENNKESENGSPINSFKSEDNKESEDDSPFDLLGLYLPCCGAIFLYIDKIFRLQNPELVLQKVLLHEFIHGFLDVNKRQIQNDSETYILGNDNYSSDEEETLDNALVLFVYDDWNKCDASIVKTVTEFIKKQPKNYKDGIEKHKLGEFKFRLKLLNFLVNKIQIQEDKKVKCY